MSVTKRVTMSVTKGMTMSMTMRMTMSIIMSVTMGIIMSATMSMIISCIYEYDNEHWCVWLDFFWIENNVSEATASNLHCFI